MKYAKHFLACAILIALSTIGIYALFTRIYTLPAAASAQAASIDAMFQGHFWLIAFLFSLVIVIMLYALVLFRRREGDEGDGEHFHSNTPLEIFWTAAPLVFVLIFGYWGVTVLADLVYVDPDNRVVRLEGFQWDWAVSYPGFDDSLDEIGVSDLSIQPIVMEVDVPVTFELTSRDVLHAFWVPEFRVKTDLLPGTTQQLVVTPTEEGFYRLLCAEICGSSHNAMRRTVVVMNSADYSAWENAVVGGVVFEDNYFADIIPEDFLRQTADFIETE